MADLSTRAEEALWRAVKDEEWSIADWRDFHDTLEGFKQRLIARHRPPRGLITVTRVDKDAAGG